MTQTYFQKGFDLKAAVAPALAANYDSAVVDLIKGWGYQARAGELQFRLARDFGFCYGVDRAIQHAYEARERFQDRRIFLSGEIIHNPDVNARLQALGFEILGGGTPEARYAPVTAEDVVVLAAFGVTAGEMKLLRERGCVVVDTTCGSVLNVWKNVRRYAREGFTALIHGKHQHEETRATASQALTEPGGRYLCVRDEAEAALVCAFVRGELDAAGLMARLGHAASPGFLPDRDLQRIGLANQTTMLTSESLKVQEMLRRAFLLRYGEEELPARFTAFDTICSATQERQDAVLALLEPGDLDRMLVIGGYNSSNTQALARICSARVATFHLSGPEGIAEDGSLRHRAIGAGTEEVAAGWLPPGPVVVGLTAGASTPNSVVARVVERVLALRGLRPADLHAP